MRVVSIVSALAVAAVIYGVVIERERLSAIVGGAQAASAASDAETSQATAAAPEPTSVVSILSRARPVETDVLVRGRTEAARRVEVRAETTGLVISEPIRRGAQVSAGQVLCRLDPGTRPEALAEAEARLLEAEANERASARLAERGFGAETAAIANRAALQAARAAVEAARREIERLEIRAPFAGVIETDTAELGALLLPGSECATVIALDPMRLTGFVPETVVGRVAVGAPAVARLQTGETVEAEVVFVARSADPATRTFRVEAEAPNPDLAIRDGITAEIRIEGAGEVGHLVPGSALTLDDAGRLGLRLVEEGRARFAEVRVIRDAPEGFWVAGLPETAEIIVVGQDFVTEGDPVAATVREERP